MTISRVIPQLYVGDLEGANNKAGLQKVGVTHVLQVMGGMEPLFRNDFKYKVMDVRDVATENIGSHFAATVKWMTDVINRGGTIFCHW